MSHTTIIIGVALNGSIHTSLRSGLRIMSDSLIVFQPAIDEPSNIRPSSSASSSMTFETIVRCCHLPLGSVKRRSTHSISSSLIRFTISDALAMIFLPGLVPSRPGWGLSCTIPSRSREGRNLNRRLVLLAGADAQRGFDGRDEDLAVADASGGGGRGDRLDHLLGLRVGHDDLELHLGQEIDDVFGPAVKLGVALLAAEALGLGHGDARDADLVQRLLHLVELERLDDGLDLFHWSPAQLYVRARARRTAF